jgi:hypothetical protein
MTRLSRIVDRSRSISELSIQDARRESREAELPVLRRRGWLIHRAIFWFAGAGIVTCLLIIAAFAAALLPEPTDKWSCCWVWDLPPNPATPSLSPQASCGPRDSSSKQR